VNAFSVVIKDNNNNESSPNVQVPVNLSQPSLTSITAFTGTPNTLSVISYSDLVTNGNEIVVNTPFVFLVNSITSGSLSIGANQGSAQPWNASTNNTINASNNAYWTPATGATGPANAFSVVIQDSVGSLSSPNVQVPVNLIIPTLTSITSFSGSPNTLSVISYSNLVANGNEIVYNTPYVFVVNSITSGSLSIGADQVSAQPWNPSTNNTIGASNNAYWTPTTGATGAANAFSVVVRDSLGTLSSPNVQVPVNLIIPTLTSITAFIGAPNTLSVISYSDLVTNGNELVVNNPFVFLVNSITSGTLSIGATQGSAQPWNATTNKTIDANNNAYWTPTTGVIGLQYAFNVVVRDAGDNQSSPEVQVPVNLSAPALSSITPLMGKSDVVSVISYNDLVTNGNEVVVNTPYVFLVTSVTSGSLSIGATQGSAQPWNSSTNKTINANNNAYWSPPSYIASQVDAFSVVIQDSAGSLSSPSVQVPVNLKQSSPCFLEGTKILCFENNEEVYRPVENLRKGDLVKTIYNGYMPVCMLGTTALYNPGNDYRITNRLYKCPKEKYPALFEDLYITGCHSILVPWMTDDQWENTKAVNGNIYVTDNHFRLIACADEKAEPFNKEGVMNIYHVALDHHDICMNYGIYANGLLVESCSIDYLIQYSSMKILGENDNAVYEHVDNVSNNMRCQLVDTC